MLMYSIASIYHGYHHSLEFKHASICELAPSTAEADEKAKSIAQIQIWTRWWR